jgi:O-acetylserine/cysteine efflux transporter
MVIISFDPRVLEHGEGLALVVLSCFFMSLGMIYIKRLNGIRPLELQAWINMTGALLLLILSLIFESNQVEAMHDADCRGWGALFFSTALVSLVAHTAWYYLMSLYPVTSLSPISLLTPLFGIFFGVTLLDDHLSLRMLAGSVVTLIGILIILVRKKRLVDTGT